MKNIFSKLGGFISRHAKANIIVILIATVVLAIGLPNLQMRMGNDVFVSQSSNLYKDTKVYQKNFGGDSVYLLLKGNKDQLISRQTAKDINTFMNKANKIDNITGGTSYVNLLNAELNNKQAAANGFKIGNSKKLQTAVMGGLTPAQKQQIQTKTNRLLTSGQQKMVQAHLQKILTSSQKAQLVAEAKQAVAKRDVLSAADQQTAMQKMLSNDQKTELQQYTMSILDNNQKASLQKQMIAYLPDVQNMDNHLLRQLIFSDHGKVPSQLSSLIPHNGKYVLLVLNTSSKTDMDTYVKMNADLQKLIKNSHFESGITIKAGGMPSVMGQIQPLVMKTMALMLSLAVVIMIIILTIVFQVRRRLLALGFVLIGLIWTFGFMGWTGIPITLATMATLPIIIGLGTDFGVQFHNRYEEEYRKHQDSHLAIIKAITNIGPAVGIAVFIMALSFLTMFLSKAPMMQQFGLTLAIGVVFCYFVDLIMMFSVFRLLDRHNKPIQSGKNNDTRLSRFLSRYAGWAGKWAVPVLAVAVILSGIGFSVESSIPIETNIQKMIPQSLAALKNTNHIQKVVGSTTYITYLVKTDDVIDPAVVKWMKQFGSKEDEKYKDVQGVTSLPTMLAKMNDGKLPAEKSALRNQVNDLPGMVRKTLVSPNHRYATIQFQINKDLSSADQLKLMNKITKDIDAGEGISVHPAGAQVLMLQGLKNIGANQWLMIGAGLAIIFVGLVFVYRKVKHAIYPLIPIVLVLGLSPGTLKLLDMSYNPVTTALSSLVLGIGTEFTILIMERFREEEELGEGAAAAVKTAISKVGQAITASGLTVVGGFSTLMFVSFPVLKTFGVITVIDTAYSLISALTILPALIILFRRRKQRGQSIE